MAILFLLRKQECRRHNIKNAKITNPTMHVSFFELLIFFTVMILIRYVKFKEKSWYCSNYNGNISVVICLTGIPYYTTNA